MKGSKRLVDRVQAFAMFFRKSGIRKSLMISIFLLFSLPGSLEAGTTVTCSACPNDGLCNSESKCESYPTCTWENHFRTDDICRDKDCSDISNESTCNSSPLGCHWDPGLVNLFGLLGSCEEGAANIPPTAEAGPDQSVVQGISVTLDGSGSSDSDGSIVSYTWREGSQTWTGVSPTIRTNTWSIGDHTITLTVEDDDGDTGTDTLVITVNEAESMPIAENADDLCYGEIIEEPLDDNPYFHKRTVPILNQGEGNLTEVNLIFATNGLLDIVQMNFDCGIDDQSKIASGECAYADTNGIGNLGLELDWLVSTTILHDVIHYAMPDYEAYDPHSIYHKHGDNVDLSGTQIYAMYIKDNTLYRGRIQSCDITSNLPYQNEYVCDVFGSVLTTYDHLYANGQNEEVCGTGSIAYPENQITGTIECDQSYTCNGTPQICERTEPPTNRYSHTFIPSTLSGTNNTPSDPTELQGLNYGNLSYPSNNGKQTIHFDPQTSYEGNTSDIKVMLLGDLYVNGGYTLTFEPGDYYFDSVTIEGNNNEIILPNGGLVRIFVHNNYEVAMNNLATNTAPGSAAGNLFIYVEGDIKDLSNGGGTANLKAYIYTKGSVLLNNNSNNWQIYGGITAEGPITINGNNPTFMGTQDSGNTGLGECSMCYDLIQVGGMTFNMLNCGGFGMMQDIKVPIWSTDPVTDVTVDEVHKESLFNFSFLGDYNVLDQDNQLIANAIEVASGWANGALGMDVSLFGGKAITYPLGSPYGPADAATHYQLHSSSLFSMGFNPCDWMESLEYVAHYNDGDRHYDVILDPCRTYVPPTYQTGPFDAWDSFRGDTNGDGKFDDKNISTKVAGKPFTLTLVNLDENLTGTELKGVNSIVTFKLYDDKGAEITGSYRELHIHDDLSLDTTFTVPYASRAVTVNFRFCSEYDGTTYTLHDDADCGGDTIGCKTTDNSNPRWRTCSSSDQFAVRPDEFAIIPPSGEDIGLLTSAIEYPFTVVANDVSGANTNEYNQTGDKLELALTETLILGDDNYDTEGLLNGDPILSNDDYFFIDGFSRQLNTESTEVVQMSFNDVGKVTFRLRDSDWSLIDLDDTPQDCNGGTFTNAKSMVLDIPDGAYICGDQNATFIPDRFAVTDITLRNHNDGNFTYLSNDLNMSAHVGVQISALNALGNITQNFREGTLFYENPVSVDLNVTDWNATLVQELTTQTKSASANRHEYGNSILVKDIPNPTLLGFGGADEANGKHTIAWNDSNLTQRLMFNYERDNNQSVNPFNVPESDINITVASTYTSNATGATRTRTVSGSGVEKDDRNVTFYFGRAKASKDFYDVEGTVAYTPITVQVYCNTFPTCSLFPDTIQVGGQTDLSHWWLSLYHNTGSGDGDITLLDPVAVLGSGSGSVDNDVDITNGVDDDITVKHNSGALPVTYDINLTLPTNSWLIYNADSPLSAPNPFYKVRFTGEAGWAGVGKTGHVLDINASGTETKRLDW